MIAIAIILGILCFGTLYFAAWEDGRTTREKKKNVIYLTLLFIVVIAGEVIGVKLA